VVSVVHLAHELARIYELEVVRPVDVILSACRERPGVDATALVCLASRSC
jgi:hypothetical protein